MKAEGQSVTFQLLVGKKTGLSIDNTVMPERAMPSRKKLSSHSEYKEQLKDIIDTLLGFNHEHFITTNESSQDERS